MNTNSKIKIKRAIETGGQIFKGCLEYLESPDDWRISRLGALLGEFCNSLRSALNYSTNEALRKGLEGKPVLNQIKRNLDFPWSQTKGEFDKKRISKMLKATFPSAYMLIENAQPYHPGNDWLYYLMDISNRDKHEGLIQMWTPNIPAVVALNRRGEQVPTPKFFGDKVFIPTTGEPFIARVPFFYEPFHLFAAPGQTWKMFGVEYGTFKLELIKFTAETPFKIRDLVNGIEEL